MVQDKLHAVTDGARRPTGLFITAGQRPAADCGHDADRFGEASRNERTRPCNRGRRSCGGTVRQDKHRYPIEIIFGRLSDRRRIDTRYHRCPTVFLVALAAAVWFGPSMSPKPVLLPDSGRILTARCLWPWASEHRIAEK